MIPRPVRFSNAARGRGRPQRRRHHERFFGRLCGEGFRVFFLATVLWGLFAIAVWEHWLGIHAIGGMIVHTPYASPPHLWHAHEMVFGYSSAALGGFLLTAVPNWTGGATARTKVIAFLAAVWLAGRSAVWFSAALDPMLVAAIDLAFLPLLAVKLLVMLIARPKPQNMMFLGLLSLLWIGNLFVHLDWLGWGGPGAEAGLYGGLLAVCAMIAVLGGRVTPAFTRNAMRRAEVAGALPVSRNSLDAIGIVFAILLAVLVLLGAKASILGGVALVTGAVQIARLAGWRTGWTLSRPILWSLHLGFAMLGVGYVATGLAWLGLGSQVAALHLLGIGAIGGMTLAVMSRAILGHTGRPLIASKAVALAYGLMALAAAFRWAGSSIGIEHYFALMLMSGALWITALGLFLLSLWPALSSPRVPRPA